MPDPNLVNPLTLHNAVVFLWAHGGLWTVAGFLAGWKLRGRLTRYSLGFGWGGKLLALCGLAIVLSGHARAEQSLSFLQIPLADSPVAQACVEAGRAGCALTIIPYCEKHKADPELSSVAYEKLACLRAEQAEAFRRSLPPKPEGHWAQP